MPSQNPDVLEGCRASYTLSLPGLEKEMGRELKWKGGREQKVVFHYAA